jgi:hypothetical protein
MVMGFSKYEKRFSVLLHERKSCVSLLNENALFLPISKPFNAIECNKEDTIVYMKRRY